MWPLVKLSNSYQVSICGAGIQFRGLGQRAFVLSIAATRHCLLLLSFLLSISSITIMWLVQFLYWSRQSLGQCFIFGHATLYWLYMIWRCTIRRLTWRRSIPGIMERKREMDVSGMIWKMHIFVSFWNTNKTDCVLFNQKTKKLQYVWYRFIFQSLIRLQLPAIFSNFRLYFFISFFVAIFVWFPREHAIYIFIFRFLQSLRRKKEIGHDLPNSIYGCAHCAHGSLSRMNGQMQSIHVHL